MQLPLILLPFGTPVLPDVYRTMAISWSDAFLDKVTVVSKFALLQTADSFLNLPNDIETVSPKAAPFATARGVHRYRSLFTVAVLQSKR